MIFTGEESDEACNRRMFLFSCIVILIVDINCQINFTMTTDKRDLIFGESLTINLAMGPNEELDNVKLEIRLKPKLQYVANVSSSTCTKQTSCKMESKLVNANDVPQATTPFTFDNRVIDKSQILLLFQNNTPWNIGHSYSAIITLDNLATGELSNTEFVIALLTYWNKMSQTSDNGFQMFLGRNFTLVPARLNLTIDDLPATNSSSRKTYIFTEHNITLSAEVDPRGLPILLQIILPVANQTQKTCPDDGQNCTITVISTNLMKITKASYSTVEKTEIININNGSLIISLTPERFGSCTTHCRINFTATTQIIPDLVKIGKQLVFYGEARYGDHFDLISPSDPAILTMIGPDLNLAVKANPKNELEAGNIVDFVVSLSHSNISSDDLYISYFDVNFAVTGLELVTNSVSQTKNGNSPIAIDDSSFTHGVTLGNLALTETIEIQFKIRLNDQILVSSSMPVEIGCDFSFKKQNSTCSNSLTCSNGGICVGDQCKCPSGYTGKDCSQKDCKPGYIDVQTNDPCYFDSAKIMTFSDAESVCITNNGHLPSLHSNGDGKTLESLLKQRSVSAIWIGLRRGPVSGWQWVDGTPFDQAHWAPFEPRDGADCAVLLEGRRWGARNCSDTYYSYCVDRVRSGLATVFSTNSILTLKSKSINAKSSLNLNKGLQIHQPVTAQINFVLPLGTLSNVDLLTVFTSSDTDKIPIMFVESKMSLPDYVSMSNPEMKSYKAGDFIIVDQNRTSARRKRSIKSTIRTIRRNIGSLTNAISNGRTGAPVSLNATFLNPVNDPAVSGIRFDIELLLQYNDQSYLLDQRSSMLVDANLLLTKTLSSNPSGGTLQVLCVVSHSPNSTGIAYNLDYMDDLDCLKVSTRPPDSSYDETCKAIRIKRDSLDVNETVKWQYSISADQSLGSAPSYRNATLNFSSINPGEFVYVEYPGKKGSVEVSTCIFRRDDVTVMEYSHDHRWSILAFILGIILAFLLCILVLYLCYRCKRRSRIKPCEEEELLNDDDAYGAQVNSNSRRKSVKRNSLSVETMTDFRDDSLIPALTEPTSQQMSRHLDRIDIYDNAKVEENLNSQKLKTMVDVAVNSIENFTANGTISKAVGDDFLNNFKKQYKSSIDDVENENKQLLDKLHKAISIKIQTEIDDLRTKFEIEKRDVGSKTEDLPSSERQEILQLLKQQQQAEMEELLHKLALEKESELQNLKQLIHAKKEALLLEIQARLLREFNDDGKITPEVADDLQQNLDERNLEVTNWFDDDRAHQRAALEELFLKRRHLALQKEMWDSQTDEMVNLLLQEYLDTLNYLEAKGILNKTDAQRLKSEFEKDIEKLKSWLQKERKDREINLHKKLSIERKKKTAELKQLYEEKMNELKNNKKVSTETDSFDLIREKQNLKSLEQNALNELQSKLDQSEAEALENLYKELQIEFRKKMNEKRQILFAKNNVNENVAQQILKEYNEHIRQLDERHESQKQKLMARLQEVLKERKSQLSNQVDKEITYQMELRKEQTNVVKKLINQQSALSDEDREKLIKIQMEHLARLHNSLALSKINQMQSLQEKLHQRKLSLIERLENKKLNKLPKQLAHVASDGIDSDGSSYNDDKINPKNILTMKDFISEKLRISRDTHFDVDKELVRIQSELSENRAVRLKEQDTTLGALIAQLQISKAKQIAQLEQQDDALQSLTTCMVEDLNDRGVLSNPDCHRILEKHQQEQQRLNDKLKDQKEKQELVLQQELAQRANKKREILEKRMKNKMKSVHLDENSNDLSRQIDEFNLMHEQALEKEIQTKTLEREMEQKFAEQRRDFNLKIKAALQEQEIGLIDNLINMGNFSKTEVSRVLRILFPDKTKQEVKSLVKNVYANANVSQQQGDINSNKKGDLSNRLENRLVQRTFETDSILDERSGSSDGLVGDNKLRKKKRKSNKSNYRPRSRPRTHLPPISKRPEPVGASVDQVAEFIPDRRMVNKVPNRTAFHT